MELGGSEMILIFFIALVVLGPDELVQYAVKAGRMVAKLRTQFENFKAMTQEELLKRANESELKELSSLKDDLKKLGTEFQKTTSHIGDDVTKTLKAGELNENSSTHLVAVSQEVKDEIDIEHSLLELGPKKKS